MPTEQHNEYYASDSGIAGTYVPNMSPEDKLKWKAKHINGKDHRVEIRKTIGGTQLLIVVHDDWKVDLSANGKLVFDTGSWLDLKNAVDEAKIVLL